MKHLALFAACAALLSGCGTTGTINKELINQPIPAEHSRIIVQRDNSLLYFGGAANVSVDDVKIASLARGASVLKDIPAGRHHISVHAPTTVGSYGVGWEAVAGKTYHFDVSPNDEKSPAMGMALGVIGDAIDNTGYFKIHLKQ